MTRESAHKYLYRVYNTTKNDSYREALSVALSALRPVSQEQVEMVWRGEWIVKHDGYEEITITECSKCGDETVYEFFFEEKDSNFCPACGAAMTDEAVEMVKERMKELK